jgi:DNA-binding response OmpR family regulator
MNFVKKILLAHGDEKTRRTLTLLLAGVGYDVRPCGRAEAALEAAHSEWFDLALLANPLSEVNPVEFVNALRKLQPRIPVLLLVDQLELPSVIQGIRLAVTDVLAPGGDWTHVMRRIHALLRPSETAGAGDLTPEELAEVEAILAKFDASLEAPTPAPAGPPAAPDPLREELQRLTRERDDIKQTAERLAREKADLEAELKAQWARHADAARAEAELTALRNEREIVAAAQAAVDEKARALAAAREELNRERTALAAERARPPAPADAAPPPGPEELARDRGLLEDLRLDLQNEAARLREEGTALREGQAALAADRQRLEEDLNLLRQQEDNLRAYEQRLRQPVAPPVEPEPEPVARAWPRLSREPFQREPSADEAWSKLNRAMDRLEAERRNFTDEKLVLKEERARIQEQEARLQELAAALEERERQLNAAPARPSFTHTPFRAAKAMLGAVKK